MWDFKVVGRINLLLSHSSPNDSRPPVNRTVSESSVPTKRKIRNPVTSKISCRQMTHDYNIVVNLRVLFSLDTLSGVYPVVCLTNPYTLSLVLSYLIVRFCHTQTSDFNTSSGIQDTFDFLFPFVTSDLTRTLRYRLSVLHLSTSNIEISAFNCL